MTAYVALLRGVNVGGHAMVAMADLRALLGNMGFGNPRSLLVSGNLVFESSARSTTQLEHRLEEETRKRLAVETEYFVRTAKEWRELVAGNPFRVEAARDPGHLLVILLKEAPAASDVKALQAAIVGREVVRAKGRHAYIVYPDGVGRSKLTLTMIEKQLCSMGTGRNWNTVRKLAGLVNA